MNEPILKIYYICHNSRRILHQKYSQDILLCEIEVLVELPTTYCRDQLRVRV